MEVDPTKLQFDSFLGGNQVVPSGLNLSEFIKHRMEEVVMLTEAIEESPFRGQAFQRLPKHMRRRQMSHYIKRLPRRLQRPYLLSLKDGPPVPTKRPSRKYRRRPGNLLLEYNRRQKLSVWLETHIWHAKRFHMITRWGYKLPKKPVNKSFKACYTAVSKHCLLIDMSYYNCLELKGSESELLKNLRLCTSIDCGLTFGAKMYLSGAREGCVTLFHPNSYPYQVIGNVSFIWQPVTDKNDIRKIWIWVHPSMHDEVVNCFKELFNLSALLMEEDIIVDKECLNVKPKKGSKKRKGIEQVKLETKNVPFNRTPKYVNKTDSVTMTLLKDTLNRFQLTGPLSQAIVSQALTVASVGIDCDEFSEVERKRRKVDVEVVQEEVRRNWWEDYYKNENFAQNWFQQKKFSLSDFSTPSDLPSGMVLGLVIEDPRMRIPVEREKSVPKVKELHQVTETSVSSGHSQSPIWIPEIRDEVSMTKLTTQQINEARARKIVPGFAVGCKIPDDMQSRVPILLVQRPGTKDPQTGKLEIKLSLGECIDKLITAREFSRRYNCKSTKDGGVDNRHLFIIGLGSGWDIITPAGFGMPVWLSFIFRGARTGGLKETDLLRMECNKLSEYLPPDSASGKIESLLQLQNSKTRYFKLPPNKRANFKKLGVASPFFPPWKALIRDWTADLKNDLEDVKFSVLRNATALRELSDIVCRFTKRSSDSSKLLKWDMNCLIPVVVECFGKGKPKDMALICVPKDGDFNKPGPVEPCHVDENDDKRKKLKSEHSRLLKSLKRKRQKDRRKLKEDFANDFPGKLKWKDVLKSNSAPSEPHSKAYAAKMGSLWLSDAEKLETVADSCSRKILGFVVRGEFSYSRSRGLGLGYVTLPGLIEVFGVCERNKSKVAVLVRNRNQVQYRLGMLRICME